MLCCAFELSFFFVLVQWPFILMVALTQAVHIHYVCAAAVSFTLTRATSKFHLSLSLC